MTVVLPRSGRHWARLPVYTGVDADPATGRVTIEATDAADSDAVKNAIEGVGSRVLA
ncbi:hypothetical protein OH799_01250 [Nocardia sp. NBC_00881]|nr:hypothetical protein OH799_01250 [Nocardia sp. NBC_00881]